MYCNDKEEEKSHNSLSFLLLSTEHCLKHFREGTRKCIPLFVLDFSIGIVCQKGTSEVLILMSSPTVRIFLLEFCGNIIITSLNV